MDDGGGEDGEVGIFRGQTGYLERGLVNSGRGRAADGAGAAHEREVAGADENSC